MKMQNQPLKKFDMSPKNGRLDDINLYIYNEKNIYSSLHVHSFYEIVLVISGKAMQSIDGQESVLTENELCILRPEAQHLIKSYGNSPLILYNFEVSKAYMDELCKSLGFSSANETLPSSANYTRYTAASASEHMKLISFPDSLPSLDHPNVQQISLKIIVTKILINSLINPSPLSTNKKEATIIQSMLSMLEDIHNFKLSIKELCEKTFYTQEHITRLFQKAGLSSPNRIHLQKKMQYAANLLLNSNLKIIEIAEQCGIETVAYFTKSFKKEYGEAPSAYKKRHNVIPHL